MSAVKDFLFGLLALIVPGFGAPTGPVYNGYVEADYLYVGPAQSDKGGRFTAGRLSEHPGLRAVYDRDGVTIFGLAEQP